VKSVYIFKNNSLNFINTLFKHIVYNYILIAICATAMSFQTDIVINTLHIKLAYYGFIFFATLFSYHLYYLKNKDNYWHIIYSILASTCALFFLFKQNIQSYSILLFIVILSISYLFISLFNLKNKWISIYKLITLSVVWFITTSIFPLSSLNSIYQHPFFFIHQFMFIFLICFHFYIRDEVDKNFISTFKLIAIFINMALIVLSLFVPAWLLANIVFLLINIYIYKKKCSNLFYFLLVDGMLLLQTIFVVLLQF